MWAKLAEWTFKFFIMPLFSQAIVWLVEYFQRKKEEADRNAAIDEAIKKFKDSVTPKEQEDAFRDLIRARRSA